MRIKWSGPLLVVVAAAALALPAGAVEDEWTVDGGGWGHGVGLSQYGAKGMAEDGRSAKQILAYYYQGSSVGQAPDLLGSGHWVFGDEALWVGLRQGDTSVALSAFGGPLQACQSGEECFDIAAGSTWVFEVGSGDYEGQCRFREKEVDNNGWGSCEADITWPQDGGGTRAIVAGQHYARGSLRLRPAGDNEFHTILTVGLEDYLYGLAEVPSSWPKAALDAQAIIGRGFAIATAVGRGGGDGSGRLASCGCHLRDDTRDQAYNGWAKEAEPTYGARWKAAVDRTAGQVVTHSQASNGIISAYYSSSNGGVSENVEDVWGGEALPWLRSVEDHWSADPSINPLARWTVFIDEPDLRASLCDAGHCWDVVTGADTLREPPAARFRLYGLVGRSVVSTEVTAKWVYETLNAHATETDPAGGRRDARVSPFILRLNPAIPFIDVGTSIHVDNIAYIANIGVTKGCNPPDNNRFCPGELVSRQQMASFLVRALHLPRADTDYFGDDGGSIHQDNINALAAAGITRGCNPPANDRFCPDRAVTRGEMAAFLTRAFQYADPGPGDIFVDDDSSIFEGDIDRLATAGVTRGCNPPANDRFCPVDYVTREQMASFLARAVRAAEG